MTQLPYPQYSSRFVALWLLLLMAVAICIRVEGVGEYHYSEDESMHVNIAQAPSLPEVLQDSLYETHPPMLYVLLHYWIKISDQAQFARGMTLVFGLALIPLYYHTGKLLGGQFCGMCCAVLVAFSHGCIIQSYVVRHYAILLFFESLAFYYYLQWKTVRKNTFLILYTVFFILACLTHFSAAYAVFCIAIYEMALMWRSTTIFERLKWAGANVIVAGVVIITYAIWYQTLNPVHEHIRIELDALKWYEILMLVPFYVYHVFDYIFPPPDFILLLVFCALFEVNRKDKILNQIALLLAISLGLAATCYFTNIYPFSGDRHSLWLLPFMISTVGYMMANVIYSLENGRLNNYSFPLRYPAAAMIFILGFASYNPTLRFDDKSEYFVKEENYSKTLDYLNTLDKTSVIVAARDDAAILKNIYPYLGNNPFAKNIMATLIPFQETHILINPYYRKISTKKVLMETLQQANDKHMLDSIQSLVFMKTIWDVYPRHIAPLPDLITCDSLNKKIISFPDFSFSHLKSELDIYEEEKKVSPIAFITISKKDFFEQVIAPNGKAHHCIAEADDNTAQ